MTHHAISFFLSWMVSPRRVGAIAPSGQALATLMTKDIDPESGPVIELGPGTGAFTYKLMERGFRQQDLTLVENGSEFARLLQVRFPGARVLRMDAARLGTANIADDCSVGSVVSGLPLLAMSPKTVFSILSGAFRYVRPSGGFYQFTYGPTAPIPRRMLDRLGLKATLVGRTMRNLPPAAVYRVSRRAPCRFSTAPAEVDAASRRQHAADAGQPRRGLSDTF